MSTGAPKLPTTAEASDYAPYSLTAILALAVAGLYALLVTTLGFSAFRAGQPFLLPVLLALPAAAVVLAFAARRQILASEGTRAGLKLADAAWWVAVVGGLGYATYLITVGYTIRLDAAARFDEWTKHVAEVNAADPRDPALFRAFHGTLEPQRQKSVNPTQIDVLLKERRDEVAWFRQCDLVRMAARNKGQARFVADSLVNWELDQFQSLQCALAARLFVPEGEFALLVPMQRQQVDGRPVWQIKGGTPYVKAAAVTRYGQMMADLETTATAHVFSEVLPTVANHGFSPPALADMTKATGAGYRLKTDLTALARAGAVGGYAWVTPPAKDDEANLASVFASTDPTREASARQRFGQTVRSGRIAPPGVLSQLNIELSTVLTVTDGKVEARVPVELGASQTESPCRGYVLVVCEDPAALGKLNELKAAAASEKPKAYEPGATGPYSWRLVRFESDMKPLPQNRQRPPAPGEGGPGVPGMPTPTAD